MSNPREDRLSGNLPKKGDARSPFQVDRDRVLYSLAFRRLAGVTQVVSPGEGEIFHNRLTHSLKVAQIARRFAETLPAKHCDAVTAWGGLDPEVVETAALAHDLGHPPFGHVAEKELNRLISADLAAQPGARPAEGRYEGYEGNAQSFRIVTELATRGQEATHALDLTRAALNATLKYPWTWLANKNKPKKYGAYHCDLGSFEFARADARGAEHGEPFVPSLEAQIMDWSDDIAYSVHDTEDFYRAGLIPLDRLAGEVRERSKFEQELLDRAENEGIKTDRQFHRVFTGLFDKINVREPYLGTTDQRCRLHDFVSTFIHRFITSTSLREPSEGNYQGVVYPQDVKWEIWCLKQLLWVYVIENPAFAAHQLGQQRVIRTLFNDFNHAVKEQNWPLFPPLFRERARKLHEARHVGGEMPHEERVRLVGDTISSMTDRQALLLHQQFTGVSATSMLDPVVT
jgi:dGTPase